MQLVSAGLSRPQQHLYSAALFTLLLALIFDWRLFGAHYVVGESIGEPVDARYNMYVLEHAYKWITGHPVNLISPPIFYPYPYVLFFSDTHFGTSVIYILFRLMGCSEYHSFNLWFLSGHFLSFWACYYVLARWKCSPLAAGIGACIFGFSLPSIAQMGHAQLVYRFCIPLAIYSTERFCRLRDPMAGLAAMCWLCWQLLINVYLGMFLALLMPLFALFCLVLDRASLLRFPGEVWRNVLTLARVSRSAFAGLSVLTLGFVGVTAGMFGGHMFVARLYGFSRSWAEIQPMLPRPTSYLLADHLPFWSRSWFLDRPVPVRWEHNMFMGVGASILLIVGAVSTPFQKTGPELLRKIALTALLSLAALVALITTVKGYTLYHIVYLIPGLGALRAVTRISVVLAFPIAVLSAWGFMYLTRYHGRLGQLLALLVAGFTAFEIGVADRSVYDGRADDARVTALENAAREARGSEEHPILHVIGNTRIQAHANHLDAMLASQRLGWPTIDGYSGFNLIGAELTCITAALFYADYQRWEVEKGRSVDPTLLDAERMDLLRRTVVAGSPKCLVAKYADRKVTFGDSPSADVAGQFELAAAELKISKDVRLLVRIKNHSSSYLHTRSPSNVRLSWRFVREGDAETPGWVPRLGLNGDVAPGGEGTEIIESPIPAEPGTYRMQVTMVAEARYWFHEFGMKVLTIEEPIVVR